MLSYSSIELRKIDAIPLFSECLQCVFSKPAQGYVEEPIEPIEVLINFTNLTYFATAAVYLMSDACTSSEVLAIFDISLSPTMVIIVVDDKITLINFSLIL
ncbi:DNA polymerase V subunit UmuD [Citrobacter freundii]|uniref:DNA polymerase V subunit UmuD n=1 Tax=Citrobacter freundii TaxID=546 RepID=UPI000C7FB070|nr:DNA polymerase V subunit UmuD [Citrobacter freundii]PMD01022.1 DNA polymerase V subunit UmuD [Citrobacter freundii]WLV32499.1 DNA polymerase V subunit UmuD [Citrobacter freundii]HCJ7433592.1 DNA polymerase V subunit UmuD [Citrobacter freundii]